MNPENVLVWENERGFLSCKLIDFGEVMPKKNDNFTPLFWDFSRLLGEMILNFVEEIGIGKSDDVSVNSILNDFWSVIEAFFKNDPSKLENADKKIGFISRIYLSTLFDFLNEAKSGMKDLRRSEVMQDYFYCQILFLLFYSKFQRENPYKRIFGIKLAVKFYEYASSGEIALQSVIHSLEKFYFEFSSVSSKNKQPQIGPVIGSHSPYKGLSYFEEKDKDYFFGREVFIQELLKAIEEKPIIALAGASGSGKSSVVHAGVFPVLREKNYLIYKFRPGSSPVQAVSKAFAISENTGKNSIDLRSIIGNVLKQNPTKKLFLLGDQFEELFTLTKDDLERRELGAAILDLAKEYKDRFRFFLTIRADFLTKLLEDPSFASVIGDSGTNKALGQRFLLSPMSTEELRSAIEKPLEVAKLKIQEGLTDLILTSVANQPGSLPLLEFCLEELWKRQIDFTLHYNSYKEIGEVKGALATYADQEYEKLGVIEKEQLKKIMLQLIQPGHGTEDTRRIALLEEMDSGLQSTVFVLADMRLITTGTNEEGKQTIEVVHEALIREWGKLREWINIDREFRVWQEKLRYAVKEWEVAGKDETTLLRGNALINSEEWYHNRKDDLGIREIEFIQKSVEFRERIIAKEKEAINKKENLKKILFVLGVAIFTFSVELSSFSFSKMKESEKNEEKLNIFIADIEYEATSSYLTNYYNLIKASFHTLQESNPKHDEGELFQKVFKSLSKYTFDLNHIHILGNKNMNLTQTLRMKFALPHSIFNFSPDGKQFVTTDSLNTFYIRNAKTGSIQKIIQDKSGNVQVGYFSSDGTGLIIVTEIQVNEGNSFLGINMGGRYSSGGYTVKLIDIESGKEIKTLIKHSELLQNLNLTSDRKYLVGSSGRKIVIWDLESGNKFKTIETKEDGFSSLVISPDNRIIFSISINTIANNPLHLWDLNTGKELNHPLNNLTGARGVSLSPDGKLFATILEAEVIIWDLGLGKKNRSFISSVYGSQTAVGFSPDGKTVAIGCHSSEIQLFDIRTGEEIKKLQTINGKVSSLLFSSGNEFVLIAEYRNYFNAVGGALVGYNIYTKENNTIDAIVQSIQDKDSSVDPFVKLVVDLLSDPVKYTYKYKDSLYDANIKVEKEHLETLIFQSCEYLKPQMENWANESKPPFPKREIYTIRRSCEKIFQKGNE